MAPRPTRVLLVDSDRRVRGAVRTLVAADGFCVVGEAEDLEQARAAVLECSPDIALVDPWLSNPAAGCDFIRTLREELGTVVLALASTPALREPALRAGAAHFFTKQCEPEELLTALRNADPLRGGRSGREQRRAAAPPDTGPSTGTDIDPLSARRRGHADSNGLSWRAAHGG